MLMYHKIPTVWKRDPENNYKTLIPHAWATPELAMLATATWLFSEKVDGTNIRISWSSSEPEKRGIGGRTDRAQIPAHLFAHLDQAITAEAMAGVFKDANVVIYGEGYGAKIQKGGGRYIKDGAGFIIFDIRVDGVFLKRADVADVGEKLGVQVVPEVGRGTLFDLVDHVRDRKPTSRISEDETLISEGVVARPRLELFDRLGRRIITKLKVKDFAP